MAICSRCKGNKVIFVGEEDNDEEFLCPNCHGKGEVAGITLEKAIEILKDILTNVEPGDPPEEHDAIKLGVEALKRIQEIRQYKHHISDSLSLPGETEE